jgi:putative oxygen-independent coproporphyrinogen III oxidase
LPGPHLQVTRVLEKHHMTQPNPALAGLYIHVPFCRRKCPYCDFFSETDLALISEWLRALGREMALYRDFAPVFDSLYLGGGTPSLLEPAELEVLLTALWQNFTLSPQGEITLEANPDDLTLEKLRAYQGLGINRLSLGVQSFSDGELAFLGRRHDAAQNLRALMWARETGFAHLSLDLIYGLPGQTFKEWEENLATALRFGPEHLSCYQLTVSPGTPLARWQAEGRLTPFAEETERNFFLFTSQFLEDHGYLHYEVSNFARNLEYRSRHNLKYWNHTPYLGLGPGAHSFRGNRRWWNKADVKEYCRVLRTGGVPLAGEETLTPEQLHLEALFLGLRTKEGVPLEAVPRGSRRDELLRETIMAGWLTLGGDRLVPTREGLVVADRLALILAE